MRAQVFFVEIKPNSSGTHIFKREVPFSRGSFFNRQLLFKNNGISVVRPPFLLENPPLKKGKPLIAEPPFGKDCRIQETPVHNPIIQKVSPLLEPSI